MEDGKPESNTDGSKVDGAGAIVAILAGVLFVLGIWAGQSSVNGDRVRDRELIKTQNEQITELNTQLAEMRGRLEGYKDGRR